MVWIDEVKKVQRELGCTYKEALIEASHRRRGNVRRMRSDIDGGGVFSEIGRYLRGIFEALRSNRRNLPPHVRKILETYGDIKISGLHVARMPVQKPVQTLIKMIQRMTGIKQMYDTLFHLFFIIRLETGAIFILEKNQSINMATYSSKLNNAERRDILLNSPLSINQMIHAAFEKHGAIHMTDYNATSTNCQRFVMDILQSNRINISRELHDFIMQDVSKLVPLLHQKIAYAITSLVNRGQMAIEGYGVRSKNERSPEGRYEYDNSSNSILDYLSD